MDKIDTWIEERFGTPNTFNRQLLDNFIEFLEKELGYVTKQRYPIMFEEEAELDGFMLRHGWIPPAKQKDRSDREKIAVELDTIIKKYDNGISTREHLFTQILALFLKPLEMPELRKELIGWITAYKDVVERNALAETPEESTEYLLTLIEPLIEEAKKQEKHRVLDVVYSIVDSFEWKSIEQALKEKSNE